jgi:hypothetical protein
MSKNFAGAKVGGYKGYGFHCPYLSLVSAPLVKNRGLEPFHIYLYIYVPHGVSSFLNLYVNVYYRSR